MKLRPNNFKESPGQYARGEFSRRHFSVLHKLTVLSVVLTRLIFREGGASCGHLAPEPSVKEN